MLRLDDLTAFSAVVMQCHDNPDADALTSAFALARYFSVRDIPTRIVYGGFRPITKPNLALLVKELAIPAEFLGRDCPSAAELFPGEQVLLITVDCQHGAGNVSPIACGTVCVIDHHIKERDGADFERIESYLGSCATLVWRMLLEEDFDFASHPDIATALYYGLYTDTNSLAELFHPLDKDLLEAMSPDARLIRRLKGSNLTREEIQIAGQALSAGYYDAELQTALLEAAPCDPNILGYISDLAITVDGVNTCIGFCGQGDGVKLSLRSGTTKIMANELAAWLTAGVGSGGGNREKAGGFFRLPEDTEAAAYLRERMRAYADAYEVFEAGGITPDTDAMEVYRKKDIPVGFVKLTDIYAEGTEIIVRTLEGDAAFQVSQDTYLMVGIQGETYPIAREKFEQSYRAVPEPFAFDPALIRQSFYEPTVRDRLYGRVVDLLPHCRSCRSNRQVSIFAKPLTRNTKVFTTWYTDGYMIGKPGDFLAVRCDDSGDIYVIEAAIFALTYEKVSAPAGRPDGGSQ